MALTPSNGGADLQVGDIVKMPWIVSRVFPSRLNVVQVSRPGPDGSIAAGPPLSMAMRLGTRPAALETVPPGAPLAEGLQVRLLWKVSQVFPETGTVRVERDGLGGEPLALFPVTLSTGAVAGDLEYVPPAEGQTRTIPRPWSWLSGRAAGSPDIEPDMLPYGFDPVNPLGAIEPPPAAPVLTTLVPADAVLGSPSFTLSVQGEGFTPDAVITFAGLVEPTTFVSSTEVTTGVDMSVWVGPDALPVTVRQDGLESNALTFTFTTAAAQAEAAAPRPDPPRRAPEPRTWRTARE